MKAYEWMVDFTPQTKWIEGKGLFLMCAEVCGAVGGGLFLVSAYFNSTLGMLLSWLIIVVLKGVFHISHLGHPWRFWRLARNLKSSWLARGFVFLAAFAVVAGVDVGMSFSGASTSWEIVFRIAAAVMALLVATYTGFVMNYVNGIPFWNSALLPLLLLSYGIFGGLAVFMGLGLIGAAVDSSTAVTGLRVFLAINAFVLAVYVWSASYMGPAGKRSARELIQGSVAPILWGGVVGAGFGIPFVSTCVVGQLSTGWVVVTVAAVLVSVTSLNYCILKAGQYIPLVPRH